MVLDIKELIIQGIISYRPADDNAKGSRSKGPGQSTESDTGHSCRAMQVELHVPERKVVDKSQEFILVKL